MEKSLNKDEVGLKGSDVVPSLNPMLPNDVLYKLLEYVNARQLLACRSLSRNWHEMTSYNLARKQVPIKFFNHDQEYSENLSDETIPKFLQTMEGRMEGPFPSVAFEFYFTSDGRPNDKVPSLSTIKGFAEVMGPYVKSYSIHLQHFYEGDPSSILEHLLCKSPNLERLRIYGQTSDGKTFVTFPPSLMLPKLKSLDIMPYSTSIGWIPTDSDHDGTGKLSFDQFSSWIVQAPSLQRLHSGFGIQIKSGKETDRFLESFQQFHQVELELKTEDTPILEALSQKPLPTLHTLILDVEENAALISSVLRRTSGTLKRLALKLYGAHNEIPCLEHLDTLELDFAEEEAEYPIELILKGPLQQSQFPKLKSLILKSYQSTTYDDRVNEEWSLFQNSVLETVLHLELIDYHRQSPEPWATIFPSLNPNEMNVNGPLVHVRGEYDKTDEAKDGRKFSMRQLNIRATYTDSNRRILLRQHFSNDFSYSK